VVEKKRTCGITTHARCTKAKAETLALYITSYLCGKLGGRAALVNKWVMEAEVNQTFMPGVRKV
jgi:hypothetical protein